MMKITKALKRTFLILTIIISVFTIFMINGLIESHYIRKTINEFKSRGQLVYESNNTRFYKVKKLYEFENVDKHIMTDFNDPFIGSTTDIFLTSRNPVSGSIITQVISKYTWIGHAGMVIDDAGKKTIEITGNDVNNKVSIYDNTWLTDSLKTTKEIALLRIKDINSEKEIKIINYLYDKLGSPYNYSFIFNRNNSFYCTDLISRAANNAGIKLNYDFLVTTGADIFSSKATYLVYYREKVIENKEIKYNVYYLSKEG